MTFLKVLSIVALIICFGFSELFFVAGCANKPKRGKNLKTAGILALFSIAFSILTGVLFFDGFLRILACTSTIWFAAAVLTTGVLAVMGGLDKSGAKADWFSRAAKGCAASLALGLTMVLSLGAVAPIVSADTDSADADTSETITTTAATDTMSASAEDEKEDDEDFPKGYFKVNLKKEDLELWLAKRGYVIEYVRANYSTESTPAYGDERAERILLAEREYVSPDAEGFTDGVAFPLIDAMKWLMRNEGWHTLDDKIKLDLINEYAYDPIEWKILTNPQVYYQWLQAYAEREYIVRDNAWIKEDLDEVNGFYKKTEDPIGNSNFYCRDYEHGPILLTTDQVFRAARICELNRLAFLPDLDKPIQTLTSDENWCLPRSIDADMARVRKADYQEDLPAVIYKMPNKNGEIVEIWGIDTLDVRLLTYKVPREKDKPTPTTATTNPPTTTQPATTTVPVTTTVPITTTPPVTTTKKVTTTTEEEEMGIVRIYYRYEDDNGVVKSKSGDWLDVYDEVLIGEPFEYPSPKPSEINRKGYRLKWPNEKIVKGVMNSKADSPWEYTVYYIKDSKPTVTTTSPIVTTVPPPTWTTPEPTTTTSPDGHGKKDPTVGETFGSNRPDDGQGQYEPPAQTTIHDYVMVTTVPETTTSRYETDDHGRVTATAGPVQNETTPAPITTTVTGDRFIDTGTDVHGQTTIKNSTDTAIYDENVGKPD